ncbi:transglutaminase TgpA family protein [Glutamicibacter halophytocola]|uniref:DUF3488 and transglutaminase-like domain-containing protein n=1 Tax=Glutamicibacter halophytocola TaxID=1933880 RepID=A0AA94XZ93_9MICC|nr:DUF3488 and transglutaminase-like domain-containing protein [Glutamicibacter halophytocola]UUX59753.1 DUF3488 and transglutaminase-like domain-containing protein [Glutamicibacter halophytocola]
MTSHLAGAPSPRETEQQKSLTLEQAPPVEKLLPRILASLCLALAVLAGMASLTGVVEGTSWFPYLVLPNIALHLACGAIRSVRVVRWLAIPAAVLIAVAAIMRHDVMTANSYGFPALQWFRSSLSEAGLQLATQVPPVASSIHVDFGILVLSLGVSLVVELLASFRRTALLVIIPLSFAPIVASLFKQQGAGIGYLSLMVLGILAYAALVPHAFAKASPRPSRRKLLEPKTLGVFGITALACVGSLIAASLWMPGFRTGMFPEGQRPSGDLLANNVDPLINLGRDLRSNGSDPFLTYYTSASKAPYLRTQVIKELTNERWEPTEDLFHTDYSGDVAVNNNFSLLSSSEEIVQMTWPRGNRNPLLPLPDRSNLVSGIQGDWQWTLETSVARLSGDALGATGDITVAYAPLNITPEMVEYLDQRRIGTNDFISSDYTQLPQDSDNALQPMLEQALEEAYDQGSTPRTNLEKAVALQDFFRSGNFVYSERTPLREGYDGANAEVVKAFLNRRQGYCVHFASAMALLAREAGIPSRIAVGYAPGVATGETMAVDNSDAATSLSSLLEPGTELKGYEVSGQQAHAWPELYLDGLGWVPFEPTPGRGYTPTYAPGPTSTAAPQESTAPEVPTSRSTPPRSESPDPTPQATTGSTARDGSTAIWLAPLAILLAAAGLCVGPWRRQRTRQKRLDLVRSGAPDAAQALWAELLSVGMDAGVEAGVHESVGDYLVRLADDHPRLAKPLQLLQAAIEQSFYAGRHVPADHAPELLDALHEVQSQLREELPAGRRILSFLFPRSLRSTPGKRATADGAKK